jgi:GNAT superfamily N-acetyltransferase
MSLCRWTLSGKMICSIPYTKVRSCKLVIFQNTSLHQQTQTAQWLLHIFGADFSTQGIRTAPEMIKFIKDHWSNGDSFYLFIGPDESVLGGIGIDLSNNEPYLSNMFIIPSMRKHGYSKILMKYAEIHAKRFEFNYIKLWCEPSLETYYKKFGYQLESEKQNSKGATVLILRKDF